MKFKFKDILLSALLCYLVITLIIFMNSKTTKTPEPTPDITKTYNENGSTETEPISNGSSDWKKFRSVDLSLELEYPTGLQPFIADSVSFREYEEAPGAVYITTKYTPSTSIENALKEEWRKFSLPPEKIIKEIKIDGVRALVTVPNPKNEDDENIPTTYLIFDNRLYTIQARMIDVDKFLGNIKFIRGYEPKP